jgi:hypothetical protein
MAVYQLLDVLTDTPLSGASPLPQGIRCVWQSAFIFKFRS